MQIITPENGFRAPLWRFFADILNIPHGSKNEAALSDYIRAFASERGFETKTDSVGNLVVRKPAAPGYEDHPALVLQGHIDMVCEKNDGTEHDFEKDPIRPILDGDWLKADGTTLGADNGIGVAAALAVLDAKDIKHPPIEALFTVDEESGLIGAMGLTPELVEGRRLINLDSEEEGIFYFGCAGGRNTSGSKAIKRIPPGEGSLLVRLRVEGLAGGHSGGEIHRRLGNAIRLGAQTIAAAGLADYGVCSLAGGGKHNAIPREFEALLAVKPEDLPKLEQAAADLQAQARRRFADDKPAEIFCEKLNQAPGAVIANGTALVDGLLALPHGVEEMSPIIHGMVESSTNLASVRTEEQKLYLLTSQRSAVGFKRDMLSRRVTAVLRLIGCEVKYESEYPAWEPNPDSPLLKFAEQVFNELSEKKAVLTAVHAGLECGIIESKIPGMDMVSFGPDIEGPHSPDERVRISSTERFWAYLVELLGRL